MFEEENTTVPGEDATGAQSGAPDPFIAGFDGITPPSAADDTDGEEDAFAAGFNHA